VTRPLHRYEGRLFAAGGLLFLVVHVDQDNDRATVTCRIDGATQAIEMPCADLLKRLHQSTPLLLDNLQGPAAARRVFSDGGGWYFRSREGDQGPYRSRGEAEQHLIRYVLLMQSAPRGSRVVTGRAIAENPRLHHSIR
jgi:hypothetical protein